MSELFLFAVDSLPDSGGNGSTNERTNNEDPKIGEGCSFLEESRTDGTCGIDVATADAADGIGKSPNAGQTALR